MAFALPDDLEDKKNTPLHLAARDNSLPGTKCLIADGAYLDIKNADGYTPLHFAAQSNAAEICEFLLAHGANINAYSYEFYEFEQRYFMETPLHIAARCGAVEACEVLLAHGADIAARNDMDWTPLHIAAENGNTKLCELFLPHGADTEARGHFAKADWVSDFHDYSITPLHIATGQTAEALIAAGASIEAKSGCGYTPLHYAAWYNIAETCEILLRHGAGANARNAKGETPLHKAAENAFSHGGTESCQILLSYGAAVNTAGNYSGATPLHFAVREGHLKICKLLLKNGADAKAKDSVGQKPIRYAKRMRGDYYWKRYKKIIALLKKYR